MDLDVKFVMLTAGTRQNSCIPTVGRAPNNFT